MGKAADARARGMKMVVVDPMCNFAAAKATEWVPLRVGTDAALALAMCNVIVNELGVYDGPYLKAKTNAPYLIGPDKLYVRDPESKTPLVWDLRADGAAAFDAVPAAETWHSRASSRSAASLAGRPSIPAQGAPAQVLARMGGKDHHLPAATCAAWPPSLRPRRGSAAPS